MSTMRWLLLLGCVTAALPASALDKVLALKKPVSGGRWGWEAPDVHKRFWPTTQRSVDILGAPGTAIIWKGEPVYPYYYGGWQATVVGMSKVTCSDGTNAGWAIEIGIFVEGARVGTMAYSHVASPTVSLWDTWSWQEHRTLGSLKWFQNKPADCYYAPTSSGTHVHMEWGGTVSPWTGTHDASYSPGADIGSSYIGYIMN